MEDEAIDGFIMVCRDFFFFASELERWESKEERGMDDASTTRARRVVELPRSFKPHLISQHAGRRILDRLRARMRGVFLKACEERGRRAGGEGYVVVFASPFFVPFIACPHL